MGFGKKLTRAAVFGAMVAGFGAGAQAAGLGDTNEPIKLALNEWTGQHITTRVAGEILTRAGYNVEYVTAGYFPQFTALVDGTKNVSIWAPSRISMLEALAKVIDPVMSSKLTASPT